MSTHKLTDSEVWAAINALRTAATQYRADRRDCAASGHASTARQFGDQAQVADALADKLEAQS